MEYFYKISAEHDKVYKINLKEILKEYQNNDLVQYFSVVLLSSTPLCLISL